MDHLKNLAVGAAICAVLGGVVTLALYTTELLLAVPLGLAMMYVFGGFARAVWKDRHEIF